VYTSGEFIKKKIFLKLLVLSFLIIKINIISASIIDNRHLPGFSGHIIKDLDPVINSSISAFAVTGTKGRDDWDSEVNIPEIYGKYDLARVAKGLENAEGVNYLKPEWQAENDIKWDLEGKLQAQGVKFNLEKQVFKNLSFGINFDFLHVSSRFSFLLGSEAKRVLKLDNGGELSLRRALRDTNRALGLDADQWSNTGLSDANLFVSLNFAKDYVLKCKKIDGDLKFGVYLPTGVKRNINNPASIAFGGNGHLGIYLGARLNLELKEDWHLGFWAELVHRKKEVRLERMPAAGPDNNELFLFGAVTGPVSISPGETFGISPYFMMKNIYNGLGARAAYTWINHGSDYWVDLRKDQTIKTYLTELSNRTDWKKEYLSLTVMYDFGYKHNYEDDNFNRVKNYKPIVYLTWDRPIKLFGIKGAAETHRAVLGISVSF